jgi:hypothetical protein
MRSANERNHVGAHGDGERDGRQHVCASLSSSIAQAHVTELHAETTVRNQEEEGPYAGQKDGEATSDRCRRAEARQDEDGVRERHTHGRDA